MAAAYDFIVDDIEEDLLVDASLLHYMEVQLRYDRQELVCKGKVVKAVDCGQERPRQDELS